jgi:hypothetical protein
VAEGANWVLRYGDRQGPKLLDPSGRRAQLDVGGREGPKLLDPSFEAQCCWVLVRWETGGTTVES